jgi:putative transposase
MSEYRRAYVPGGTFFFTVKTFERRPILTEEPYRATLRLAIDDVRKRLPFQSIAWVLLPDHLHTVWKLPEADANFSLRWSLIKQSVTRQPGDWPFSTFHGYVRDGTYPKDWASADEGAMSNYGE